MALITPWIDNKEFIEMANRFKRGTLKDWEKLHQRILVWKARVDRIPVGVEFTLSLTEAQLAVLQNQDGYGMSMLLCAAITRVLNLVTQTIEKTLGISKFHEAAAKLEIPGWIVDIRHQFSHSGSMPSLEVLRRGLNFLTQWIAINFWDEQLDSMRNCKLINEESDETNYEVEKMKKLLECYNYLIIYRHWGHKTLGELKNGQAEVYEYVNKLWEEIELNEEKSRKKIDSFPIPKATKTLFSYLSVLIKQARKRSTKLKSFQNSLVKALVEMELLIPDAEFIKSLLNDDEMLEILEEKQVPQTLVIVWRDILSALDFLILPLLISLYKFGVSSKCVIQMNLAFAWINYITQCLDRGANQEKELELTCDSKEDLNDALDEMIAQPSEFLLTLLPTISRLRYPNLSPDKEEDLRNVIEIFLGLQNETKLAKFDGIKSVHDANSDSGNPWVDTGLKWKSMAFDMVTGSLDLSEGEDEEMDAEIAFDFEDNVVFIKPLDWDKILNVDQNQDDATYFYGKGSGKKRKKHV